MARKIVKNQVKADLPVGADPAVLRAMLESGTLKIKSKHSPITDDEMQIAREQSHEKPRNRTRVYVTLDPDALRIAKRIGSNIISRGIDRALFHYADCIGRKPRDRDTFHRAPVSQLDPDKTARTLKRNKRWRISHKMKK